MLSRHDAGLLAAGAHRLALSSADFASLPAHDVMLRVQAISSYTAGPTAEASTGFRLTGGTAALPAQAMLFPGSPNPARNAMRLAFVLPASSGRDTRLRVFDSAGLLVRDFAGPFAPGRNEVVWDGAGARGARVAPGVYFARLHAGTREITERLVRLR